MSALKVVNRNAETLAVSVGRTDEQMENVVKKLNVIAKDLMSTDEEVFTTSDFYERMSNEFTEEERELAILQMCAHLIESAMPKLPTGDDFEEFIKKMMG